LNQFIKIFKIFMALPTVTTQAVSDISTIVAKANGNITSVGGANCNKRGFVYGLASHSDPGNIAPALSDYDNYIEEVGNFGTGTFLLWFSNLLKDTKYYVRAYAHNSSGYSYGDEVNFTTLISIYPASVYSPRSKENKAGVKYNPSYISKSFSEDVVYDDNEIVAIETELGTNPKGAKADVKTRLDDVDTAITGKLSKAVAGELAAMTLKSSLVSNDIFLLEDSQASNAKKKTTWSDIV